MCVILDEEAHIPPFALNELLPPNTDQYYRYEGSLTTPPCYESVKWTLFKETIEIAEEQVGEKGKRQPCVRSLWLPPAQLFLSI